MAVVSICVWTGEWGWVKEFKKEKDRAEFCGYANGLLDEARRIDNGARERRGESKPVSSHYTWRRGTKKRFKCFFEEISQRNEIFFRVVFLFHRILIKRRSWAVVVVAHKRGEEIKFRQEEKKCFKVSSSVAASKSPQLFYDRKLIFRRPCTLALQRY